MDEEKLSLASAPGWSASETHLYLQILQDFPALIWRAGTDGLCNYFNSTWLEFTGRSLEQEKGNGWAEGVHPDDLERCLAFYTRHFEQRIPFRMEYRLKHHTGQYRWILDIGRPYFNIDQSFQGYIGSCYDVSESKELEQELRGMGELRDRIFGLIGHDLRNMLGSIQKLTQLWLSDYPTELKTEQSEWLKAIEQTSDRAAQLLNNLLEWAMVRAGKKIGNQVQIEIRPLLEKIRQMFGPVVIAKEQQVKIETGQRLLVHSDPDMIASVLRNLLSNAIKYTPAGGTILLYARELNSSEPSAGNKVKIGVEDHGVGMDQTTIDNIRRQLVNKSKPGTKAEAGVGLGLVLCQELLQHLGTKLDIDSQEGRGSNFSFQLQKPPVLLGEHS